MYCTNCGKRIENGKTFCSSCQSQVESSGYLKNSKNLKSSRTPKPRIIQSIQTEPEHEEETIDNESKEKDSHDWEVIEDKEKNTYDDQKPKAYKNYKCPSCGGEVQYIQDYNDYWCGRCQSYPFRRTDRIPVGTSSSVRAVYAIALLTSLVGGLLLLFTDFGGWYYYDYYHGVRTWGNIGPFVSPLAFAAFFLVALGLFYCSFIALWGLRTGEYLSRRLVLSGLIIAFVVLIIVGIGAGALFALVDASDIWLDAGFYGGAIGSLLTVIFFGINLKNSVNRTIPQYKTTPSNTRYDYQRNSSMNIEEE